MRKAIGWIVSWALFWSGHMVSKLMHMEWAPGWLYVPYNKIMGMSSGVQDWGGGDGPWDDRLK